MSILKQLARLFDLRYSELVICRRYVDMNGRYIGEAYLNGRMIGASLDTFSWSEHERTLWRVDTKNDFLRYMAYDSLRIGGSDKENDKQARQIVDSMPFWRRRLIIQNRFVEHVLESKKV